MYLNNITQVDHAYIDDSGYVVGGSWNISAVIEGIEDPVEKVVIDFGTCKKLIKACLDDHKDYIYGFDHRLWIIDGFSDFTIMNNGMVKTDAVDIFAGDGSIKFIPNCSSYYGVIDAMEFEINQYIQLKLGPGISIKLKYDEEFVLPKFTGLVEKGDEVVTVIPFKYVHGLKDSTSYGCQNIAHGHLSCITLVGSPIGKVDKDIIYGHFGDVVFAKNENISEISDSEKITISYSTPKRGGFNMVIKDGSHDVIVLETETTVENLAKYIAGVIKTETDFQGVVYVSEGLTKGAYQIIK
jgi:hypothetical protein